MNRSFNIKALAWLLLLLFMVNPGCEKKSPTESSKSDQAPTLPPAASIQADLQFFNNSLAMARATHTLAKNNWLNAAIRVTFINSAIALGVSFPASIFAHAASEQPKLDNEGKFHWLYNFQFGSEVYSADLAGWLDAKNQESVWQMLITSTNRSPQLIKFLWYEGRAKVDGSSGYWLIYNDKQPESKIDFIRIDYIFAATNMHSLVFENVTNGNPNRGDKLTYQVNQAVTKVNFWDASENQSTELSWDSTTGSGYLQMPGYNNGQKSCWDANKDDIYCFK